ncbi:DNA-3-methyladenine glycosylase I [Amphibacillus sediminis]|uniref:DNA-3-methyladenine glycosylase I n=1 Tax=Amphibacillus sediminis TaxID=360185 RepID=UPI00082DF0FF|nr:DNA-3-methyladenine glycosylase I [Amphibacillus sediminis]
MHRRRCAWVTNEPLYQHYHDHEWGIPVYDDHQLFEILCLEGAQAGLSWWTILQRREYYRKAFDQFMPEKIVHYNETKLNQLLQDKGIIRNKLKIKSVVTNAHAYYKIKERYPSFSSYLWQFVDGKPIKNHWESIDQVPATTTKSHQMSKQLKRDGFKFVGPTICYAFMQASGMVNDHTVDCFRYKL